VLLRDHRVRRAVDPDAAGGADPDPDPVRVRLRAGDGRAGEPCRPRPPAHRLHARTEHGDGTDPGAGAAADRPGAVQRHRGRAAGRDVARRAEQRSMSVRTLVPYSGPRAEQRGHISQQTTLREVMSQFATGITVLTAGGERAHGMTANAFSSVSLDPPMVLCCVSRAARMHEAILTAQSFAVSILADEQRDLARYFADWRRPRGIAQFDPVDWYLGPYTGAPLLAGCLAWL